MDTRLLRYFLTVAEYKNFTAAAKHLYITQSALSHHIAELEKELEARLFIRTTRSVALTPAGHILQDAAEDLIAQIDQIAGLIHKAESGVYGELKIGYLTSPFKKFLPDLLLRSQQEFPDIKLHCTHQNIGDLYESLEQGNVDIAFTYSVDVEDSPIIAYKPVFCDGISIAARADHPMWKQNPVDLTTLAEEPFVTLNEKQTSRMNRMMAKVCAARGLVPNIVKRSQMVESVLLEVEAGLGIALLPTSIMASYPSDLKFIELEGDDTKFYNVLAWRKDNTNPSIPLFIEMFDRARNEIESLKVFSGTEA